MNIVSTGIVGGISTLKDGTVKVVIALNEINPEDAGKLFQLNNQYVKFYMSNENVTQEIMEQIDEWEVEQEGKSPAKRLRNVLYRLWEQDKQGYEDSELFYRNRVEKIIEQIKNKLT